MSCATCFGSGAESGLTRSHKKATEAPGVLVIVQIARYALTPSVEARSSHRGCKEFCGKAVTRDDRVVKQPVNRKKEDSTDSRFDCSTAVIPGYFLFGLPNPCYS